MRVLVTGDAGFLGSHLCDALYSRGDSVVCVDNLSTGRIDNIAHLLGRVRFEFIEADVSHGLDQPWLGGASGPGLFGSGLPGTGRGLPGTGRKPFGAVAHLASPASPPEYLRRPLETLAVGSSGTEHALEVARRHGARFVLASTSEVYGDPGVHPQPEGYWGNVNPIGPRSVCDEAKRFAGALTAAYTRYHGMNTGIIRIFNTYGPRMSASDRRIVTNFIGQALTGRPLTIYGDGSQTRSFCYVTDLVRGIVAMIDSDEPGPVNLGNPEEFRVDRFAELVLRLTGSRSPLEYRALPADDPSRRRPVIGLARERLGWEPVVPVADGLRLTVDWFRARPGELAAA